MKRSMLVDEINTIFERQRSLGSRIAREAFQQQFLDIMLSQRSFDEGPGNQPDGSPSPYGGDMIGKMVGKCTLEPDERRAAKACYTSERFVLAQKLSHLRIKNKKGEVISLEEVCEGITAEIAAMAHQQKKVTYAAIRKKAGLSTEYLFSDLSYNDEDSHEEAVKKAEKAVLVQLTYFHQIREAIGEYDLKRLYEEAFTDWLDEIGTILTLYKSDDSRRQRLQKIGVSSEQIEALLECNPAKFQHLSLKAMKKIIPFLEQGYSYDKACLEAGYDFKAERTGERLHLLKGKEITEIVNEIPNPVVKRAVSQTFKVINAIIIKYGSPQAIHIELARDLARTFEDRKKITKTRDENQKDRERAINHLKELGLENPSGRDVLMFRLWKEQGECCMYSGKRIPFEKLFGGKYAEIDHIIPFSKCFDDRYNNKVLVLAEENQNKGNRLPYEAFGSDEVKWNQFQERVERLVKDRTKQSHLLKQELTAEDVKAFKQRNISDTSYTTTFVLNILQNYLEFAPFSVEGKVRKVIPVNGRITHFLRVRWGLEKKDRSTDTHHAVDAVLVACCTQHMVHQITRNLQAKEIGYCQKLWVLDEETGEKICRRDYSDDEWIKKFGKKVPLPWPAFHEELDFRMSETPELFIKNHPKEFGRLEYPEGEEEKLHAIFVSRMPRHKVTGAAHEDTIRRSRHFEEQKITVSKVPLTALKYKDGEILNYYNPETDKLLYEALCRRLGEYDGDAKKAFEENFYKPKADGSKGPLVRKVKVWDKITKGVEMEEIKGIAANGDMIRVDVFREDKKYYFVPIYVSDVKKKELPDSAVVAYKPESQWKKMKDENFLFSLYPNDLFYFEHKKGMNGKTSHNEPCVINKRICYFKGANIATASFSGILHDSSVSFGGLGIQTLVALKKYQVDVLGNVSEVKKEKRMYFGR